MEHENGSRRRAHRRRPARDVTGSLLLATALAACVACAGGEVRLAGEDGTPHETYAASLRHAGLHRTALGRAWIEAADRALARPTDVEPPHREVRFLDPQRASAVAFALPLEAGQRLVVDALVVGANPAGITLFLDLFYAGGARSPERVASADSARWHLEHVAERSGRYLLRLQPELLRGGRVTVTLITEASLAFPLPGRDLAAMRSAFGDLRRGGRRHEGIDVFAPRGTPVVAATAGRVTRVGTDREGGNVVWLRDGERDRRLYYAHLERHAVAEGATVTTGDTLGYVGTTGNARTTRPHLHFGVYMSGRDPVDPAPHLRRPPRAVEDFTGDGDLLGQWARMPGEATLLRPRPDAAAEPSGRLPGHAPVEVVGGAGRWSAVRLPDGRQGYVATGDVRRLSPLGELSLPVAAVVRRRPSPEAVPVDSLAAGATVARLGRFGGYTLVRHAEGSLGWIGRREG